MTNGTTGIPGRPLDLKDEGLPGSSEGLVSSGRIQASSLAASFA
jgi:hypothetical protein